MTATEMLPTRELLERHVDELHRRIRGASLSALADELARRAGPVTRTALEQLVAAITGTRHIAEEHLVRLVDLDKRWRAFDERWARAEGPRQRRQTIIDHLHESVASASARRADILAIERCLDREALRERHLVARHGELVLLEIATTFLGRATAAALGDPDAERARIRGVITEARVLELVHAIAETGSRWQLRHAALVALARCAAAISSHARGTLAASHLGLAVRCATSLDEHPWIQGAAMRLVLLLSPDLAFELLGARLLGTAVAATAPDAACLSAGATPLARFARDSRPASGHPSPRSGPAATGAPARTDFLVRRQLVSLLAEQRTSQLRGRALELLQRLHDRRDPSVHVRQGVSEALISYDDRESWRALAGLDPAQPEPSPRARGHAVEAMCRASVDGDPSSVVRLITEVLATDASPLVLSIACDDVVGLVERQAVARPWLENLLTELLRLSSRTDRSAPIREAAAAAAERIDLARTPDAAAWRRFLADATRDIPIGGDAEWSLATLDHLPALPDSPDFLGRVMATLSRSDVPLSGSLDGGKLRLWRGDRQARRGWRVLHEAARPAPNKRQGHRHTVGRVMRGELRAPPGGLDEVTATVVPGERLYVAEEGGWGRHLPTVDDVLDLPIASARPVHVYSSYGVTTITPPSGWTRRVRNRLAVSLGYARLADARVRSLRGTEPHDRRKFTSELRRIGVDVEFRRHHYANHDAAVPDALATLMAPPSEPRPAPRPVPTSSAALVPPYFTGLHGNSQLALSLFLVAFAVIFFVAAHRKRARIEAARAKLPFTIGGWGTRGKSGTERLKAAVFHGLGYEVSVKTTGCEAMMIHSVPDEAPHEIFIFRSYDKATIWEQRDIVETAAALGTEVFLWECMALQPEFVELLQNDWMRDDIVTLTNAFPDHEDVQGPTGADVADCISRFIPRHGSLFTSEVNFLPLFAERCRERGTALHVTMPRAAELIAEDVLALFPYSEHPRNIALVADLAVELGIDRDLALATMAEHVVPDLGVLKAYPQTRVRGRTLTFFNGMSANERTGFLNNWERMGLGARRVDDAREAVVTVVNNRWDRVARSEVFARIMVEDAAVDAHVLIGTNLRGLRRYVDVALARYLPKIEVLIDDDLRSDAGRSRAIGRLTATLARLRVPAPSPEAILARIETYAAGARLAITEAGRAQVLATAAELCSPRGEESVELASVTREVTSRLSDLEAVLSASSSPPESPPEVVASPEVSEVMHHVVRAVSAIVLHARLRARLERAHDDGRGGDASALPRFAHDVRTAYRALFEAKLVVVADSGASGDQVIDRCARAVPPGTRVSVMGIQNIKGTGLDFVYRWLALDQAMGRLGRLDSEDASTRLEALHELETFEDYGLVDAGAVLAALDAKADLVCSEDEARAFARTRERVAAIHTEAVRALTASRGGTAWRRVGSVIESMLDPIDSVRRRRRAKQVMDDLIARRISHGRAAKEMRRVYERQSGGWLFAGRSPAAP